MIRTPLLLVLSGCFWTATAPAKELKLPVGKPVVSIDIADDWNPEFITRGVQAETTDRSVYLAIEVTADPKEMSTIIDESDTMLKTRKVTLDRSSRRDNKFKIKNFPAEELIFTGTDENGPVTVSFTFVTLRDAAVVLTYWASTPAHHKYQPALGKIFDSIKMLAPASSPAATP